MSDNGFTTGRDQLLLMIVTATACAAVSAVFLGVGAGTAGYVAVDGDGIHDWYRRGINDPHQALGSPAEPVDPRDAPARHVIVAGDLLRRDGRSAGELGPNLLRAEGVPSSISLLPSSFPRTYDPLAFIH